jgi:hypothetical protein
MTIRGLWRSHLVGASSFLRGAGTICTRGESGRSTRDQQSIQSSGPAILEVAAFSELAVIRGLS